MRKPAEVASLLSDRTLGQRFVQHSECDVTALIEPQRRSTTSTQAQTDRHK
jgi:hypothetical protein